VIQRRADALQATTAQENKILDTLEAVHKKTKKMLKRHATINDEVLNRDETINNTIGSCREKARTKRMIISTLRDTGNTTVTSNKRVGGTGLQLDQGEN
jgi:ABC-type transporter Mla subunit MlaD